MAILAGLGTIADVQLKNGEKDHPIHPVSPVFCFLGYSSHQDQSGLQNQLKTARPMQFDYPHPTLLMDVDTSQHLGYQT
jgi:hypothetical protein